MNIYTPKANETVKKMTEWFLPLKLNDTEKDTTKKTLVDIFVNKDKKVEWAGGWNEFFILLFRLFRSYEFSNKTPEMYESEFKKMCLTADIKDEELNNMTLEEFVYLFAGKMPEIFENEEKLQKEYDDAAAAAGSSTTRGGSKNKSRKHSTRKPRHSCRYRQRINTRKYKKYAYKRV
jgi:hypothetical protein